MTIAQNPESAAHDSMPQSAIAAAVTDCVLPPEEMPARLIEHLGRLEQPGPTGVPAGGREELPDYLARIRAIVQAKIGHDFNYYRSTIGTDTPRNSRCSCRGVPSGSEFPHVLKSNSVWNRDVLPDLVL